MCNIHMNNVIENVKMGAFLGKSRKLRMHDLRAKVAV